MHLQKHCRQTTVADAPVPTHRSREARLWRASMLVLSRGENYICKCERTFNGQVKRSSLWSLVSLALLRSLRSRSAVKRTSLWSTFSLARLFLLAQKDLRNMRMSLHNVPDRRTYNLYIYKIIYCKYSGISNRPRSLALLHLLSLAARQK